MISLYGYDTSCNKQEKAGMLICVVWDAQSGLCVRVPCSSLCMCIYVLLYMNALVLYNVMLLFLLLISCLSAWEFCVCTHAANKVFMFVPVSRFVYVYVGSVMFFSMRLSKHVCMSHTV